jgi:hypothetical protein
MWVVIIDSLDVESSQPSICPVCWAHSLVSSRVLCCAMIAIDLELMEDYPESMDKVFKHVVRIYH